MNKLFKALILLLMLSIALTGQVAFAQDEEATEEPVEAAVEARTLAAICEDASTEEPENREFEQPEIVLEFGVDYRAVFCTQAGPVYVDLFETYTPATVNNFVFLAQNNYYNNTTFHRVLQDFMAQAGDPTGTGSGGPGYQFQDEFTSFLTFDRTGLLAMANAGPGTNGSQFFITTAVTDWLNGRHTIFGDVLQGQDVVEALPLRDPNTNPGEPGASLDTVVIVTDPATVDADVAGEDVALPTQEDFQASIDAAPEWPEPLVPVEGKIGTFDLASLVEQAGEGGEALDAFLTANNFSFAASMMHENAACDLEAAPFGSTGYSIYVFDSKADAEAAAISDDLLTLLAPADAEGLALTDGESIGPIFARNASVCDTEGTEGYMVRTDGRFVIVSYITLTDAEFGVDLWLDQVINVNYDNFVFPDVLKAELLGNQ